MEAPVGMILAGGQATRMGGGDKGLRPFRGATLLDAVVARLSPQVADLALNAGGDPARFARFHLPVIADSVAGQPGPLAGILAGMDWAVGQDATAVVTVPCDTPFLPGDLVPRLMLAGDGGLAVAESGGRLHPTAALWPVTLRAALRAALMAGERRVRDFAVGHGAAVAVFPLTDPDGFANANTPEELEALERR